MDRMKYCKVKARLERVLFELQDTRRFFGKEAEAGDIADQMRGVERSLRGTMNTIESKWEQVYGRPDNDPEID